MKEELYNLCNNNIIYFAHPINTYNTEIEDKSIESIKKKFINSKIINPGEKKHQDEFDVYRRNNPNNYMKYFKDLVSNCTSIVYLPFRDDKIGAGIRYEVYQLNRGGYDIYRVDPIDYSISKVDMDYVDNNTLSIGETRIRIKTDY